MRDRTKSVVLLLALAIATCGEAFALHSYIPPRHHTHPHRKAQLRRMHWNPVFRPSRDSLLRQNEEINRLELPRIQNEAELQEMIEHQDLVPIVPGETLRIDPRLAAERRYCRPWTRDFLADLSGAYYKQFHAQIQVNSAVRTVEMQKKLRRHNRNAAPEAGETASSHLAGITVDIQRRGMTRQQVKWMEQYLLPMRNLGLVEPEEERHQWVFHVAVSGRYADWRDSRTAPDERQTQAEDTAQYELVPSSFDQQ